MARGVTNKQGSDGKTGEVTVHIHPAGKTEDWPEDVGENDLSHTQGRGPTVENNLA